MHSDSERVGGLKRPRPVDREGDADQTDPGTDDPSTNSIYANDVTVDGVASVVNGDDISFSSGASNDSKSVALRPSELTEVVVIKSVYKAVRASMLNDHINELVYDLARPVHEANTLIQRLDPALLIDILTRAMVLQLFAVKSARVNEIIESLQIRLIAARAVLEQVQALCQSPPLVAERSTLLRKRSKQDESMEHICLLCRKPWGNRGAYQQHLKEACYSKCRIVLSVREQEAAEHSLLNVAEHHRLETITLHDPIRRVIKCGTPLILFVEWCHRSLHTLLDRVVHRGGYLDASFRVIEESQTLVPMDSALALLTIIVESGYSTKWDRVLALVTSHLETIKLWLEQLEKFARAREHLMTHTMTTPMTYHVECNDKRLVAELSDGRIIHVRVRKKHQN